MHFGFTLYSGHATMNSVTQQRSVYIERDRDRGLAAFAKK